jgi:hypothetical protein
MISNIHLIVHHPITPRPIFSRVPHENRGAESANIEIKNRVARRSTISDARDRNLWKNADFRAPVNPSNHTIYIEPHTPR